MSTPVPATSSIEAIVFDYGGVLSLAPFDTLLDVEVELGLPPGTLRDDLQHGVALADAELGTRSAAECFMEWLTAVQTAHGVEIEPGKVFAAMAGGTLANVDTLDLVDRLHGRYRLAVLTNNIREIADHWRELVGIDRFELVIDSHEIGIRKPDPAIYELLLEKLDLQPSRVVFVDDTPPNIVAAAAIGIHAIHFTSAAALEAELRSLGVELTPRR